jgi:hypothetical protein
MCEKRVSQINKSRRPLLGIIDSPTGHDENGVCSVDSVVTDTESLPTDLRLGRRLVSRLAAEDSLSE